MRHLALLALLVALPASAGHKPWFKGSQGTGAGMCLNCRMDVAGGTISSNTTWQGNVFVNGDVIVAKGAKLTVGAGTTVTFTGHYMLEIRGQIDARGTSPANRDIVFTTSFNKVAPSACSSPPCGWRGIRIRGDGVPTAGTYAAEVSLGSPTLDQYIENTVLEYGIKLGGTDDPPTYGVYAEVAGGCIWTFEQRLLHFNGNLVRFCSDTAAFFMYNYPRGSAGNPAEWVAQDNDFEDNWISLDHGGAIAIFHSGATPGQCADGTYGCGTMRVKFGHMYRNVATSYTAGGYWGYEADTILDQITFGTGGNANSGLGGVNNYDYNTGVIGSLTVIP